ncbi:NUDIX hydrolase [Syntrophobotulus glycolicus DSM 8271]|uniref:NUDIX hydrolase n=1 Tax=Syntrophobotulus glycolicus (strain DSM 8271 / FlGlyR) TaxID=645991 RepID=F0T2F2_SYNGF|nr:NUDIX hydrolase [Syntrophobotulus glycolicus]ADY55270.1 NUDIX hydrolase [Syntrophobotulus glycolicus DSM 8271]
MGCGIQLQKFEKKIKVRFSAEKIFLPKAITAIMEDYWESLIAEGAQFRRGEVFSIVKIKEENDALEIFVQLTDYAHYLSTINNIIPAEYACRVIYTAAIVETKDGKLVFGEMAPGTSTPGRLQCAGGGLDYSDIQGQYIDLTHNVRKELLEELGLDVNNKQVVLDLKPEYLKAGGINNFLAAIFSVRLAITEAELKTLYSKHIDNLLSRDETPEFSSLVSLDREPSAVEKFLESDTRPKIDFLPPLLREKTVLGWQRGSRGDPKI